MNSALLLGHHTLTFESDCLQLVNLLNNEEKEEWPTLMAEFEEFLQISYKFMFCSINFIPRTLNTRADSLPKEARIRNIVFLHVQVLNGLASPNPLYPK